MLKKDMYMHVVKKKYLKVVCKKRKRNVS